MEENKKPPVLTNFKSSVSSGIANASQLAAKSSERSSLRSSLSLDYLTLGKELFTSGKYQADFANEFKQLNELTAKLSAVREPVFQAGESYLDQAKVMALKAKKFAEEKVLVHQMDKAFQRLGDAAYQKHGSVAGSEVLQKSIAEKLAKIESLDSEIAHASGQLKANFNSSVSSGGDAAKKFFSKRPNQIVAGFAATFLVFIGLKSGCGVDANTGKPNALASDAPRLAARPQNDSNSSKKDEASNTEPFFVAQRERFAKTRSKNFVEGYDTGVRQAQMLCDPIIKLQNQVLQETSAAAKSDTLELIGRLRQEVRDSLDEVMEKSFQARIESVKKASDPFYVERYDYLDGIKHGFITYKAEVNIND